MCVWGGGGVVAFRCSHFDGYKSGPSIFVYLAFTDTEKLTYCKHLTLKVPNKNCSRRILIFYIYLSKKIRLDFSCESSA